MWAGLGIGLWVGMFTGLAVARLRRPKPCQVHQLRIRNGSVQYFTSPDSEEVATDGQW